MKVTKEKTENCQAYLTVEMEPAEMEEPIEAAYRRLAQKANIPGFRRGKAPRAVLEHYVGRESVLEEAIKKLVPQAYEQAVKEQEIEPFAQPDIEITQNDPLVFKAVVPLPPTVEPGGYQSLRLTPEPVEDTGGSVDAVLEEMRHQNATWEPVERPADYGDMVVMNIDSVVGERPFIKRLGVQYRIVRDSVSPVPGFAEKIAGMQKGEEKEFSLTFPEDYAQKGYAGREVAFKAKVEETKEEKLPDLDDNFARQVSNDLKTMDALREEVAKGLRERAEARSRMAFEEKVIKAVIEQAQVAYPPVLAEMEINRLLNDSARHFQMSGRSMEEYLKNVNKTEAQLREEFRPVAEKNMAGSMVLGRIAEVEKIEVADAEIDAEMDKNIESMTSSAPEDKKAELRKLIDTPQTRESIRRSLLTRRTIERLVAIAKGPEAARKEAKEAKK